MCLPEMTPKKKKRYDCGNNPKRSNRNQGQAIAAAEAYLDVTTAVSVTLRY